jgi:hypothetical protein
MGTNPGSLGVSGGVFEACYGGVARHPGGVFGLATALGSSWAPWGRIIMGVCFGRSYALLGALYAQLDDYC